MWDPNVRKMDDSKKDNLNNRSTEHAKSKVVTNKMILIALVSPFFFSVSFMFVGYLIGKNHSSNFQKLAIIFGAILGILVSVIEILVMQVIINRKLAELEKTK